MDSRQIRQLFLRFFEERGHKRIPSMSLVPVNDPTLLFTSAGMVQFKPYFMGLAEPPAPRMTSVQKCFRTSDIEEVGDAAHHTFFEMLGNFSVGDYFKGDAETGEGAIPWAWQLLTTPQPEGLGLDKSKLWATIHLEDEESFELWKKMGIPEERIVRWDESENYWFAGGHDAAGPCGPNSEIYYEFGPPYGPAPPCGMPDNDPCTPPLHTPPGCQRFVELWNLVFMTLYQAEDGSRTELPQKNVDTGAGLERWPGPLMWEAGVDWRGRPKQWKRPPTNYDSDLFQPVLTEVGRLAGKSYSEASESEQRAMRVVAEHARAAAFLIADGVTPSNEGRGYVLRRLIRRGTSFGQQLRQGQPFLETTASAVIDLLAGDHESLAGRRDFVLQSLRAEESRFFETLWQGKSQLAEFMRQRPDRKVEGRQVFYLWDTHGFPPELTLEMLREEGFEVQDEEGFQRELEQQRARSRAATTFGGDAARLQTYAGLGLSRTEFVGYETTTTLASVKAIVVDGEPVQSLGARPASPNSRAEVVLDRTPFYAEGGGQVGDSGEIVWSGGRFAVSDTQYVGEGGLVAHIGALSEGALGVGDAVEARVDEYRRRDTMRNHTATHILHAALRQVLGSHVRQAGSLVAPDRLRFDFTHLEALTAEQIAAVEDLANRVVRANIPVGIDVERYEEAIAGGALAFFGDKYAETVRVVAVCDPQADHCFSKELCGGTHCHATGDIGVIVVTGESSIGAGMRRIEALTGSAAVEHIRRQEQFVTSVSAVVRAPPAEALARINALQVEAENLTKRLQALERRAARDEAGDIVGQARRVGDTAVLAARVHASNAEFLRDLGDGLKQRLGSAVILLGAEIDGRPSFLAMSTPDVARRVSAGDVVRAASRVAGGGGGGRPELAQGGGTDVSKIDEALQAGRRLAEEKLGASDGG